MIIRRMKEADIEQVTAIETQCFSLPWSANGFLEGICKEDNIFLVAEESERICGYLGLYVALDEGEITNVAVSSIYRGMGIGKNLVKECIENALSEGVNRIVLEVRVSNLPAIHVYESCGFVNVGVRKGFYDFPKEDAYIMVYEKMS